jgi:hypothetical protein
MKRWTAQEIDYLTANYRTMGIRKIAAHINRSWMATYAKAYEIGLSKADQRVWNKVIWTNGMIIYLYQNYKTHTNAQLSDRLGLKKTVVRNKLYELGLQRMKLEYWPADAVTYLKENYQTMGDVEIVEVFKQRFPKKKGWTKSHIGKKRMQLKLFRTTAERLAIFKIDKAYGGKSCTIDKNSSSKNMHPKWIAQQIAWRDKTMQEEIMKHPELIELKKHQIILQRQLKSHDKRTA